MSHRLPRAFYLRDTATVARELLGATLVHVVDGERVSGMIVETEAYLGIADRACHSYGDRRTPRTESLYLAGGHAYVYLIYGMYHCFNVVTRDEGVPEAVLIRALEPREGLESMHRRRTVRKETELANGPGKLCRALAIDRGCDRLSLQSDELFIEAAPSTSEARGGVVASPRIGVDYAGDASSWPLRFYLRDNLFVSRLDAFRGQQRPIRS